MLVLRWNGQRPIVDVPDPARWALPHLSWRSVSGPSEFDHALWQPFSVIIGCCSFVAHNVWNIVSAGHEPLFKFLKFDWSVLRGFLSRISGLKIINQRPQVPFSLMLTAAGVGWGGWTGDDGHVTHSSLPRIPYKRYALLPLTSNLQRYQVLPYVLLDVRYVRLLMTVRYLWSVRMGLKESS